jgi:hypothetical protein
MGTSYHSYEVVLAPAAVRFLLCLRPEDRVHLANTLCVELLYGPNAAKQIRLRFASEGIVDPGVPACFDYMVTPLSFRGYTAIHRPLTPGELTRLQGELHRPVDGRGCYVFDILDGESAFRRPRLV